LTLQNLSDILDLSAGTCVRDDEFLYVDKVFNGGFYG
jgi:hypothetical protein